MTHVIINPGTEPVEDASVLHAIANIGAFIADLEDDGHRLDWQRDPDEDSDGRYGFRLLLPDGSTQATVDMPGIPLHQVRWQGNDQNPWLYPRLYVNGSSWLWCYALGMVFSDDDEGEG